MVHSQLREGEGLFNSKKKKSEKTLIVKPETFRTQLILSKFLLCKPKQLSTANNKTFRLKQLSKQRHEGWT